MVWWDRVVFGGGLSTALSCPGGRDETNPLLDQTRRGGAHEATSAAAHLDYFLVDTPTHDSFLILAAYEQLDHGGPS